MVIADLKFKQVKVVEACELEACTRSGWVVLQVLPEQRLEQCQRQEVLPAGQHAMSQHGYQTNVVILNGYEVVNVHRYLIGLDEASALARLNEELHQAKIEIAHLADTARNQEVEVRVLKQCKEDLAKTVTKIEAPKE